MTLSINEIEELMSGEEKGTYSAVGMKKIKE